MKPNTLIYDKTPGIETATRIARGGSVRVTIRNCVFISNWPQDNLCYQCGKPQAHANHERRS